MLPVNLEELRAEHVLRLVAERVREQRTLDYKEALPEAADSEKKEFLADVVSLANAGGGNLVFGVKERRENGAKTGEPETVTGIVGPADEVVRRLEEVARSGVVPRIPGLQFQWFDGLPDGRAVLVVRVPRSWAAQPTLLDEATRWLGSRTAAEANATSEDVEPGQVVTRRLYLGEAVAAPNGWQSLRTVLRVETETCEPSGKLIRHDNRYLISSMPQCRLSKEHWLLLVRRRWGVETAHQILDTAFAEDDHPWIEAHPRAALVVAILRRIAYTLLSLFRSVTQRSGERRAVAWKTLMTDVLFALVTTSTEQLQNLRRHRVALLR